MTRSNAIALSVIIPTFRRPAALCAAVDSVLSQSALHGQTAEIVIVDNDPDASAYECVSRKARNADLPIRYIHAAKPGVSNARNAGVAASKGAWIAFLDDDEIADPAWLGALQAAQARFDADVVFGPVRAKLPEDIVEHRDYFEHFFSRSGPARSGVIDKPHGCGNSLVRRDALPDASAPFSPARNAIGGEDDLLFSQMKTAGARFAWACEANVWEAPEPSRIRLAYTLRRAFAYGQGPCAEIASKNPGNIGGILVWMAIGAGQACIYGLAAAAMFLARSPRRAAMIDRAARGLGKVFWGGPFKQAFYGGAAA